MRFPTWFISAVAGFCTLTATSFAQDDGPIGQVQQPLVSGELVDPAIREQLGLVTLSRENSSCSGSLINNHWVLTAAHCIDSSNPAAPMGFANMDPQKLNIIASWGSAQSIRATSIVSFRPLDIAVVQLTSAMKVFGKTEGFTQSYCCADPYPEWDHMGIELFGRGINQFASGSGNQAIPSQSDGQYRFGRAQMTKLDPFLYWYDSTVTGKVAGGDSGGPSFVVSRGGRLLVGVHALCRMTCVEGQACGQWRGPGPQPAGYSSWRWATETLACADAPVQPVLGRIRELTAIATPVAKQSELEKGGFGHGTPGEFADEVIFARRNDGRLFRYVLKKTTTPGGPLVAATIAINNDDGAFQSRAQTRTRALPIWEGPTDETGGLDWACTKLLSAGIGVYCVRADGRLDWVRFGTGGGVNEGPKPIGSGWHDYEHVFGGGGDVIYAINRRGELLWFKHSDALHGTPEFQGPKVIGSGWAGFRKVFSGGDGEIFAIRNDGLLFRWKHKGHRDGSPLWETAPDGNQFVQIGEGWGHFSQVFASKQNILYAIDPQGQLFWYRYGTVGADEPVVSLLRIGSAKWEGPVKIGEGWQVFTQVFATLPGAGVVGGVR